DDAAFADDGACHRFGGRTEFGGRRFHDLAGCFVEVRAHVVPGVAERREVCARRELSTLLGVELALQVERGVVHRLAVAVDGAAGVADKIPRRGVGVAPTDIELFDGNTEHVGNHHGDTGVRFGAGVPGADGHVDLAVAAHPDQAVAGVA